MVRSALALALALTAAGCQGNKPAAAERPAAGTERGDCRAGNACDPGLLCLSNLCVRPPPADCAAIGEQMASIDLGNYAEPETRAPVVAKYKQQCEAAHVTKDQGACIAKATDKWAIAQCAPDMVPELKSTGGAGDCTKIADRVRAQMSKQMSGADPQTQQMLQKVLVVMQESCEQDGWPGPLKQCILLAGDSADAMTACQKQMPPEVQQKLQQRLMNAMQPPTPPPPPAAPPTP